MISLIIRISITWKRAPLQLSSQAREHARMEGIVFGFQVAERGRDEAAEGAGGEGHNSAPSRRRKCTLPDESPATTIFPGETVQ